MKNKLSFTLLWVTIFSIAMGFLESAVVIYIRALYYPEGFNFPIKELSTSIAITEVFREAATLIMLLSIGFLSAKKASERFAWFIYSFAIWDIFYYIFLYLLLGWPSSFLTWDVLFMIPVTWVGPVIAPIINSLMMIVLAMLILYFSQRDKPVKLISREWILLIGGSLFVLYAYTEEYSNFMLGKFSFGELIDFTNNSEVMKYATSFIPCCFKWFYFIIGSLLHLGGIVHYYYRVKKT